MDLTPYVESLRRDLLAAAGADVTGIDLTPETMLLDGEPLPIDGRREARCSRDLCVVRVGGRTVLATRSFYLVPVRALIAACRRADVVVSERRLPRGCDPRWLRLDRETLARTGGVAIALASGRVATVRTAGDEHPWRAPERVIPPRAAAPRRASGAADGAAAASAGSPPTS